MGEVATVAAIAGGIMTSGITGVVTWKVSRNSTSVELVKVAAENHRLRYGNQEDERRNRQSTYHRFLDASTLIFQILGVPVDVDEREEACSDYNHLLSGVILFGPPSVREGAGSVNEIYRTIWSSLRAELAANPEKPYAEQWVAATEGLREEFGNRMTNLVDLMHADVTKGIASDP